MVDLKGHALLRRQKYSDEELERESLVTTIDMQTVQVDGQSMHIVVYI